MSAKVLPLKRLTIAPSHLAAGWWLIWLVTGKTKKPVGAASNYQTAAKAAICLAHRLNAEVRT